MVLSMTVVTKCTLLKFAPIMPAFCSLFCLPIFLKIMLTKSAHPYYYVERISQLYSWFSFSTTSVPSNILNDAIVTKVEKYSSNFFAIGLLCPIIETFSRFEVASRGQGIKTNGSELRPRKVELASAHKKRDNYREYFTHNNEAYKNPYKTTLLH